MKQKYSEILNKFSDIFPVPVRKVAEALGYKVVYFELDEDTIKISGFVDYSKKQIGINGLDREYRQRFTIAHEIAHIINEDNLDNDFYIDYRDNINGKNRDPKEILANKIAADLLMPKNDFKNKFYDLKKEHTDRLTLMHLSLYFGVSNEIAKEKIKFLRLL